MYFYQPEFITLNIDEISALRSMSRPMNEHYIRLKTFILPESPKVSYKLNKAILLQVLMGPAAKYSKSSATKIMSELKNKGLLSFSQKNDEFICFKFRKLKLQKVRGNAFYDVANLKIETIPISAIIENLYYKNGLSVDELIALSKERIK